MEDVHGCVAPLNGNFDALTCYFTSIDCFINKVRIVLQNDVSEVEMSAT